MRKRRAVDVTPYQTFFSASPILRYLRVKNDIAPALLRADSQNANGENDKYLLQARQRHEPPRRARNEPTLRGDKPRERHPRRAHQQDACQHVHVLITRL